MVLLRRDRGATRRKSFRTRWCVALRTCDARFLSHDAVASFRRSSRPSRPWALDRRLPCRGQVSMRTCVGFPSTSVGKHEATYERREARRWWTRPIPVDPSIVVGACVLPFSLVHRLRPSTSHRPPPSSLHEVSTSFPPHVCSIGSIPPSRFVRSFVRSFSPSLVDVPNRSTGTTPHTHGSFFSSWMEGSGNGLARNPDIHFPRETEREGE